MKAAHPVTRTVCSRIKGPLLDEESHMTSKQKMFNTTMPSWTGHRILVSDETGVKKLQVAQDQCSRGGAKFPKWGVCV